MNEKITITEKQYDALVVACDAIVPSVKINETEIIKKFGELKASDLNVADRVLEIINIQSEGDKKEFKQLLSILSSALLGITWMGSFKNIMQLSKKQREKMLLSWQYSKIPDLRKGFHSLRKLATFIFYTQVDKTGKNPTWEAIEYPGPLSLPPQKEQPIQPFFVEKDTQLCCDVVVIGSGAGGGLAAGMLAEAGFEVILVEKGNYVPESEMNQQEADMFAKMYEKEGTAVTKNGSVTVLAGSCLGGGTTVNWSGSFYTPDNILQEWASNHELPHLLTNSYQESAKNVLESLNVNSNESPHNPQNEALWRGSEKLGSKAKIIPRNVKDCSKDGGKSCGYCGFGCQKGNKQSTLKTWIQRAYDKGAKILVNTTAQKVLIKNGEAYGLEASQKTANGKNYKVQITAKKVVVAASAIHTPALLLRSGVRHVHLGRHLYFHPTIGVAGVYKQKMNGWWGTMMSTLNDDFSKLDGNYGFKLETPPMHTGVMALAFSWQGGQHKEQMLQASHIGAFIVLTRDKFGGRITIDKKGEAVMNYKLSVYDKKHMFKGIEEAAKIQLAAGAESLVFPHYREKVLTQETSEKKRKKFFESIPSWGWRSNQFPLFTAHQMGTCRMGGNAKTHPLMPTGEMRGVKNLYVADGSAFPASSGVNPMISIMTLTHYTIKNLIVEMS
ncbi:MAG: GMC family oxidoreductase N-terminal domain-containing protein [Chitinophagales bacterium]